MVETSKNCLWNANSDIFIPPLEIDGKIILHNETKAHLFNNFFTEGTNIDLSNTGDLKDEFEMMMNVKFLVKCW